MHIGRIPAQTPANVTDVVAKILAYETAAQPDDWQRRVVFVADNCADGAGDFHALTDESRLYALPALYDDRTIYYGNPGVCPQSNYSGGKICGPRSRGRSTTRRCTCNGSGTCRSSAGVR